jgi:WD40 repeat protein
VWEVPSGRLLQRLTGAGDGLELAAFSPDGTEVVGAARDGVARIWDVASGALRLSLQGHSGAVWYAEFDPAGRRILTAGDDGSARIWDRASGHAMADLEGHSALVWRAHFSADGERVMSASGDGSIAVWRAADPYLVQHLDGIKVWCNSEGAVHGRFWSMACDPLTRVWEVDAGGARLVAELPGAQGVAVAAAGKRAVTRSGQTLTVWSLPQGREERRLSVGADLTALDVGGDARLLAGSTDGVARLFRLDDGSPIATIGGHEGGVSAVAFDRDGRRFATAATSGKVRLFRGDDPRPIGTAEAPRQVNLLLFSPDGRWLGVASDSAPTVLLWDTVAGAPLVLRGAHDHPVELRFSGAGDRIVAASQDGSASIWDLPSGKLLAKLTPEGQYLADAAIDPSGQVALAGDGAGDLRFFETATGQRLGTLRGMGTPAHRIAFLGGQRVVVLGAKADLSLWSIPLADEQLPVLEQETACKSPAPPPGARCTN